MPAPTNKATRQEVYAAFDSERNYQEETWPDAVVHSRELSIGDSVLLVEEYAARARTLWSKEHYPEKGALDAMRKIGGIATRCMERHGAIQREGFLQPTMQAVIEEQLRRADSRYFTLHGLSEAQLRQVSDFVSSFHGTGVIREIYKAVDPDRAFGQPHHGHGERDE